MQIIVEKNSERGMTLIELMVSGIISVIVAGVFFVLFSMYNSQMREDTAYLTMQKQYETLSEEIAFKTRYAHNILPGGIAWHDSCDTVYITSKKVLFYNTKGFPFGGIDVSGDTIQEYDTATADWKDFYTGNGVIHVDPTKSEFVTPGCKNSIKLNLTLAFSTADTTFYLDPRKDEFLCRN